MGKSDSERKPWLNYHKPGAPVREFNVPSRTARSLFIARIWLLVGANMGAHRFYLWKPRTAILFALIFHLLIYVPSLMFEHAYPELNPLYGTLLSFLCWTGLFVFEYYRLKMLTLNANHLEFGQETSNSDKMERKIRPYYALRPAGIALGVFYFLAFLFTNLLPNTVFVNITIGLFFFAAVVGLVHYIIITYRIRKGVQDD